MSYKTGLSWRHRIGAGELGHWLLVMLVCSSAGGIFQYSKKVGQTLSRHTSVSATKAISICLQGSLLCPAASASAALLSLTNKVCHYLVSFLSVYINMIFKKNVLCLASRFSSLSWLCCDGFDSLSTTYGRLQTISSCTKVQRTH